MVSQDIFNACGPLYDFVGVISRLFKRPVKYTWKQFFSAEEVSDDFTEQNVRYSCYSYSYGSSELKTSDLSILLNCVLACVIRTRSLIRESG